MKIVITNDDGYDQPGLVALAESVGRLGDVTVVAPAGPHSHGGHQVTMRTPIRVEHQESRTYVVHGTPADCTRLAVKQFVPDVDWILSGINPGANLGSDVYQSGTVAAAREAAILGVRAIALSQYIAPGWEIDWTATTVQVVRCLHHLLTKKLEPGQYWNVNLPSPITSDDSPIHRFCPLDSHPHRYEFQEEAGGYRYRGMIHDRPRSAGSDVDVCFEGMVSVTRLEI